MKGTSKGKTTKLRTSVQFHRTKTQTKARAPKAPKRATKIRLQQRLDKYAIIRHPLSTDTAMKKIEHENTIVFVVDVRANKQQIKLAAEQLYNIKVEHVNTLVRPDGAKKAYVRLTKDQEALQVASKLGIF